MECYCSYSLEKTVEKFNTNHLFALNLDIFESLDLFLEEGMGSSDDTKTEKRWGRGNKSTVLMFAWSAHLIKMQFPGASTMYVLVSAVKNSFF